MPDGMLNNLEQCVRESNTEDISQPLERSPRFHGMAVDWVHGLAFWTENQKAPTIKVYDLVDGFYKTLIDSDLVQPKAIVVDPSAGK